MKKLLALLVSSIMVCGGGISVCAEPQLSTPVEGEFTEYYKYTSKIYNSMTISNKPASCKSTIMGFSDKTTKVVVTHTLEKKSGKWWIDVTSWSKTFNTYTAIYSTSKSSLSSGTYRLKTIAKVYNGSDYETITIYISTASC